MHVAVIEFARNVAGLVGANSTEFDLNAPHPVIFLMTEWLNEKTGEIEKRDLHSEKGATMRLGAYPCTIVEGSFAEKAYGQKDISERHRHRYEFNNDYRTLFTEKGLLLSGLSPRGDLVEIVEIPDHPWFLGCQFHPEFKSRPMNPHPLFKDFIAAAVKQGERS
jgi:CTP synthase